VTDAKPEPLLKKHLTAFIAGGVALALALVVYVATGPTLGLFFGGLVIVTLLLPPMVLCERSFPRQALVASAVNDAVALAWVVTLSRSGTSLWQWIQCYLVLASYTFALWGMTRALRAIRVSDVPAAALTVITAMLWLTWPVWLARALTPALVDWLVPAHPPLALNAVLKHLGIWSEHAVAYRHLMNLGQDVPYQLPAGILAAVFAHVIVGGILFAIASTRADENVASRVDR
jgi:hypothetical protein